MNCDLRTQITFHESLSLKNWLDTSQTVETDNSLIVVHLNIRSIRKNWDSFIVQIVNILDSLDVIILSEVSCHEGEISLYNIDGFHSIYSLRQHKRGGGIILYFNTTRLICTQLTTPTVAFENVTCLLEPIGSKSIRPMCIHAVYRPPTASSKISIPKALEELEKTLESLLEYNELIVIGDTNLDLNDYGNLSSQYEANLASFGQERGIWGFTKEIRNQKFLLSLNILHAIDKVLDLNNNHINKL